MPASFFALVLASFFPSLLPFCYSYYLLPTAFRLLLLRCSGCSFLESLADLCARECLESAEASRAAQLLFYSQQLVVLGYPICSTQRAGLDLARVGCYREV